MRQPTTVATRVTPSMAKNFLKGNTSNRNLRSHKVTYFANIIREGRWQTTNQGIGFNCIGTLIDGQHRLHGIVEAGIPVWVNVTQGISPEAITAIDSGMTIRTPQDCQGLLKLGFEFNREHSAIARAIMQGFGGGSVRVDRPANDQVIGFLDTNFKAISFASELSFGAYRNTLAIAAVSRAWYSSDRSRLMEFAEVSRTGSIRTQSDDAAIKFTRFLDQNKVGRGSNQLRKKMYLTSECLIKAFLEGRKNPRVTEAPHELFLLPGETI